MRLFVNIKINRVMYIYRRKSSQGRRQPEEVKKKERKDQALVGDKKAYSKEWIEKSSRFPHNSNFHSCPHCAGRP